uniref:Protein kinase domain-containing protein n=1 Tax=Fagus sylvatica TaxID=28930 RepID=A0A2N9G2E3_FAGSY
MKDVGILSFLTRSGLTSPTVQRTIPSCSIATALLLLLNCTYLSNVFVYNISVENSTVTVGIDAASVCYDETGITGQFNQNITLLNTPLTFSNTRNKFTALGCDNLAFMDDADGGFGGGCFSFCGHNKSSSDDGSCSGFGCCQTPIPKHLKTLNMTIEKINSTSDYSRTGISCSYAFLTDPTLYNILDIDLFTNPTDLLEDDQYPRPPVVLDWVVGKDKCEASEGPFRIRLWRTCRHCPLGMHGDGKVACHGVRLTIIFAVIGAMSLFVIIIFLIFILCKRRRREKNFIKHGGLVLENQRVRIFKEEELIKATQNYNHLLGQGGFGSVYKGVLLDKTIIAVKKPRVDKKNLNIEFQHEIRIISQVNHKNVVKLLGLCLHTDVPFLVYEYISNGTLYDLLHKTRSSFLRSWKNCLKIAEETASALNYLHSSADPPIIHRDVKSANILLDEHHTAKVSDFGASVLIPTGQNGIATTAQGTPGYLDPEYLTTGNLTAKSDVYSFGVVLVELLTGHNPCTFTRFGKRSNLIQYFNSSLQDNNLFQILNVEAVDRIEREQIQEIANLAMNCMNSCGEKRPTMMEVAEVLGKLMRVSQANFLVQHNREETESLAGDFDLLLPSRGFENATSLMGCQLSESHLSESSSILNSDVSTV